MKGEYDALAACGNPPPAKPPVSAYELAQKKSKIVVRMKDQFLPVVISRHSGKSTQILEGNWGKYLKVSLTMWKWFTRKLSQTQGLGSEISRLLGLFPAFFFKHWNPRRRWPLNLRIMVKFQWSNPNILEVEVSATPKTASVRAVYFRIPPPKKKQNRGPWVCAKNSSQPLHNQFTPSNSRLCCILIR